MNLFEKIQNVRNDLRHVKIKMTGKNLYAKYDYFELDDFLPPLTELMLKYKITAIPSFTNEIASLTVINSETPEERYTITSPFGTADLKGCHEVQCIGAVETYQRRYLYQAMFDISESDGLNKMQGTDKAEQKSATKAKTAIEAPKADKPKDKAEVPFPDAKNPAEELKQKRMAEIKELMSTYSADTKKTSANMKAFCEKYGFPTVTSLPDVLYEELCKKIAAKEL